MSPRRDADARRARGLLLAFALLASQASAWVHAAAISHVACLEHGEAVHGRAAPADPTRGLRPGAPTALAADLATAGGHDHCGNAALLRWRDLALTAPASLAPIVAGPGGAPSSPPAHVGPRAVVYRLAPKTSPPPSV